MLKAGMDPTLIETGVEGLNVTSVTRSDGGLLIVQFNHNPVSGLCTDVGLSAGCWYYRESGHHITGVCPTLTLKSQIDWQKPIRAKTGHQTSLKILCDMPDLNLVLVHAGNSTLPQLVKRDTGRHATGAYGGDVENAPAVTTKYVTVCKETCIAQVHASEQSIGRFPGDLQIALTFTDGIVTDVEIVTPNKEPHL